MKFNRKIFFDSIKPTVEVRGVGLLPIQTDGLTRLLDFIEADTRWDEMDEDVAIRTLAYFLGTVQHECTVLMHVAGRKLYVPSFQPVEEMGSISYLNRMYDTRTDLGNTRAHDGDGARNAGDGYVQNTGGNNARTTGRRFAGIEIKYEDLPDDHRVQAAFVREGGSQRSPITIDANTFIREHELLRVPRISYLDAIDGMLTGRYTGKRIGLYINENENDTFNARRVINGITSKNRPKVVEIEGHTAHFARALRDSLDEGTATQVESENSSKNLPIPEGTPEPEAISGQQIAPTDPNSGVPESEELAESKSNVPAFTAYIPNADKTKSWFKRALTYLLGANVAAQYYGLPPEIRYALLGLLFLVVGGTIFFLIHFRKQIFSFVMEMNRVRAQNDTANFDIKPAESGQTSTIATLVSKIAK